jgi:hypothetical protein
MTTRPARSNEQPATRTATCRQSGCAEPAVTREGFCEACKGAYGHARTAREAELAHTASQLARANPEWVAMFADARTGEYERMLEHAAAHQLQYGGLPQDAMSLLALHDYLADSMDRVRRGHG